jgi:enamine deaminase RidA (YjgF/YER057c/UK114 family)
VLRPKSIPSRGKPYSQGFLVKARRLLFIAGQVPIDRKSDTVGKNDIAAQVPQVFRNIGAVLKEADADFSNVVQFTTFIVGAGNLPAFYEARNKAYKKLFPKADYPPNTLLVIERLANEDFLLEIQAIAALD